MSENPDGILAHLLDMVRRFCDFKDKKDGIFQWLERAGSS
jgi:hypothetical protein